MKSWGVIDPHSSDCSYNSLMCVFSHDEFSGSGWSRLGTLSSVRCKQSVSFLRVWVSSFNPCIIHAVNFPQSCGIFLNFFFSDSRNTAVAKCFLLVAVCVNGGRERVAASHIALLVLTFACGASKRFIANETSHFSMTDWIFITSCPGWSLLLSFCLHILFFHHLVCVFARSLHSCISSFLVLYFFFLTHIINKWVLQLSCIHSHLFASKLISKHEVLAVRACVAHVPSLSPHLLFFWTIACPGRMNGPLSAALSVHRAGFIFLVSARKVTQSSANSRSLNII